MPLRLQLKGGPVKVEAAVEVGYASSLQLVLQDGPLGEEVATNRSSLGSFAMGQGSSLPCASSCTARPAIAGWLASLSTSKRCWASRRSL